MAGYLYCCVCTAYLYSLCKLKEAEKIGCLKFIIMWHWHQHQWYHITKNWYMFQSSGTNECSGAVDNSANSITWLKCPVTPHFDYIELINVMVVLMMASVSSNAKTDITWPKHYVGPHFNHLNLSNQMVPLTVPSVSCTTGTGASSITSLKEVMSHLVSIIFT